MPELGFALILKSLGAVAFTAALFWGFSYFLKKFSVHSHFLPGHGKLFRVIYRQPLEGNVSFWLIESLGKFYLMSGTADNLKVVDILTADQIPQELLPRPESQNPDALP